MAPRSAGQLSPRELERFTEELTRLGLSDADASVREAADTVMTSLHDQLTARTLTARSMALSQVSDSNED